MRPRSRNVRRRRIVAAIMFTAVALVSFASGAAVVTASRGSPAGPRAAISAAVTINFSCPSAALAGRLPALVSLPAGYDNTSARYPVVYFLHGLPANPDEYRSLPFVASAIAAGQRPAIVVQPQGSRRTDSDREYLDWDVSEDWPRAISHDLVACIDRHFRTRADRLGRALIGLSAGGYGAFNIGLRTLGTFGAVESWSGYFAATNPAGTKLLNLGSAAANSKAAVPSGADLKQAVSRWPSLIAFYVGAQDSRFLGFNKLFDVVLTHTGVAHVFRVYPGGHSGALWGAEAQPWLEMALSALSTEGRARHRRG